MAGRSVRCSLHVPRCHQVRIHVVVGDRGILVGAGDAIDPEAAGAVVMAEAAPQPGRLDEQTQPGSAIEVLVVGRVDVADDGVGDVGVDVKGRGAGRPVRRTLFAADGSPRERCALQSQLGRAVAGQVEGRAAPTQLVRGRMRNRVGEHRQDKGLRVPKGVTVISAAGQPLSRDRPPFGASACLHHVEEGEPNRLLKLRVALDLDIRRCPE